jgi:outer membrane protein assembly factor BamB/tRNA A-37 threonylcarbamoyl transferase component Bud32
MTQITTQELPVDDNERDRDALTGTLQPGTVLQDRYRVVSTLGIGGFSTVYKARDLRFQGVDKMCAVKEMVIFTADPKLREQTIQSFEQEASMLAVLNHPSIPLVSDYFTEGNRSYLILELVEGKNLEQWLEDSTEDIDQALALGWALQICEALVHLHSQKPQPVIFRDLKPSNIMLDKDKRVRLIDFGIAKLFEADQARGTMIGTEGYTPPEQYRGEATPAADIYAFGATLHQLLTRQDPRQETPFTFAERPIRAVNPNITPAFEAIIMHCLAYDAKARFPDAMVLKEELLTIAEMDAEGVKQGRVGGPEREAPPAIRVGTSQVQPLWIFQCEDEIRSRAALAKGIVFTAAYDNNLYAVSADRGEFLWKFPTKQSIGASPYVYEDAVFVGSADGNLYSLQLRNGRENWRFPAQGPIYSSPTGRFDNVFFGADDGYVYAVNALRGSMSWRANAYGKVRSTPLVSEEGVIFGTEAGEIYSIDLSSGKSQWQVKTEAAVTSSPALAEDIVVVGSMDGAVYALDASSGWRIWRYRTFGAVISSPVIDDQGIVYIGSASGYLHAIDIDSGTRVWTYKTNGQIASSPAIWNGAVYFGSTDGAVYGLTLERGDLQWRFETNSQVIASPLIEDGVLYIGTTDYQLYALPV